MSNKGNKKKAKWLKLLVSLASLGIGAACGALIVRSSLAFLENDDFKGYIWNILLLMMVLCVTIYLQVVIHEAGHLVFGLLTGYRFSSFRIGSLMLIKTEGKFKFKKYSLAGTGGQCLMCPPDLVEGKLPYKLYNLGGPLMNLIFAIIFRILYLLFRDSAPFLAQSCLIAAIIGLFYAITNGIPMRLGEVDNDGYNAKSLGKDPEALKSFWMQMKVNDELMKGTALKDMPEEWFAFPDEEHMKNSMVATQGVFACNRLMEVETLKEADEMMEKLLSMETGILGLHRCLLISDRTFCELVGENNREKVEAFLSKDQRKIMKALKTLPSVMRTEYACALFYDKDEKKAEKIIAEFEKMAKKYPYPVEIETEKKMIEYAEKRYHETLL